jgi:hypothetical protein
MPAYNTRVQINHDPGTQPNFETHDALRATMLRAASPSQAQGHGTGLNYHIFFNAFVLGVPFSPDPLSFY